VRRLWAAATITCLTIWLSSGCREGHQVRWDQLPPGTVLVPVDSATAARNAALQPGVLATVPAVPVVGWTGPGGRPFEMARRTAAADSGPARRFGTISLTIALRNSAAALEQYPCTSCHQGRRVIMREKRIADAHQNIRPVHPKQTGAKCATCHAADNVELLALENGDHATFDQVYELCAQCHFAQVAAWAGGAHGKRLDGWEGRRVVLACTACHDPHRPAIQPRIPFRAPQLERARSHTP